MIELVLSDLDDTLIRYGLPHITQNALDAIHAVQAAGVHFGPATGRIGADLAWMFDGDEAAYATGVRVNGQMVYLDGELIHGVPDDSAALDRAAQAVRTHPGCALVLYDVDTGETCAVGVTMDVVRAAPEVFKRVSRVSERVPDGTWYKANVHVTGDRAFSQALKDELTALCPELDFVFPNPRGSLFDVLPHKWNKASGAEVLRKALGIEREEVCVFGDAENDLSVIRAYPNATAVSNAATVVSDFARWHIGSTKDDAVAEALYDIAEATPAGRMPNFMSAIDNLAGLGFRVSGAEGLGGMR